MLFGGVSTGRIAVTGGLWLGGADPSGTQGDGERKYVGGGVLSHPLPPPMPATPPPADGSWLLLIFGGPDIADQHTDILSCCLLYLSRLFALLLFTRTHTVTHTYTLR